MKVRMLAVFAILSLAAWLPVSAQQTAPAAPAKQESATAPKPDDAGKSAVQHACCCMAKAESSHNTTEGHDHAAMNCRHGKDSDQAKASCCGGRSEKEMACCAKGEKDHTAMQCCAGMKEGQCPAKDGKSCCAGMKEKAEKGCCAGMNGQCPAHSNG